MRLPRRRGVAWAARAEPPQPPPAPRRRRWLGRSSHHRGWSAPAVLSGPLGRPKAIRRSVARPRPRDAEGRSFHPPRRAEAGARRTSHGAADFRALLHRRVRRVASAVASGTTLVPSMGFGPLQGSSGFRFDPAVPSRRDTTSAEPRFGVRGARARFPSAANRVGLTCNRDPFPGSPPSPRRSASPGRRWGAEAESRCPAFSARPRNPRWRVLPPPLGRSRGRTPGRCPQSLSGTRSREYAGLRCPRHAGCHPKATPFVKAAPQGDFTDLHGVYDVKEHSEE
jgi:hypothetical protein